MKNQLLLLLSFFLLTSMAAHAVKVEGTVLDENKETVIGATVQLKGAAGVGTITDMDGKFVMQVPDVKEGVLIVSYIGYKTKHIPLRGTAGRYNPPEAHLPHKYIRKPCTQIPFCLRSVALVSHTSDNRCRS